MSAEPTRSRVLLIGLGPTTLTALEGLAEAFDVAALVRDADDSAAARARELSIPVRPDSSIAGVRGALDELRPDAVVVSSYNRVLGADLLGRCPFVNVHYAPLPRLRGRATVNWAIINGEAEASISIHHLVAALDAGGILYSGTVPIGDASTVRSVYAELNALQQRNIAAAVKRAIAGDPGRIQDEAAATYSCTRVADDGEIDWSAPTSTIDRLLRALGDPYPAAFTWLGLTRVEVEVGAPMKDPPVYEGRIPGRVVRVDRSTGEVDVLTGDGVLRLSSVRVDDGAPIPAASVINSVRLTLGLRPADLVRRLKELEHESVTGVDDSV